MSPDPDRHYYSPATSQLLKSLTKLEHERQLQFLASQLEAENNSCILNTPSHINRLANNVAGSVTTSTEESMKAGTGGGASDSNVASSTTVKSVKTTQKVLGPSPSRHSRGHSVDNDDVLKRPLIVIIRHGKTEHNKLGLFTG